MKKPIIRILLSVLLVVTVAVGGTLAFLIASDNPVINTFALMEIETEIEEPDTPGSASEKEPTVQNTGTANVYVRAIAYVVMVKDENGVAVEYADPTLAAYVTPNYNTENWQSYDDGYYYYNKGALAPGGTTEPLFNGVTVDVDNMPTDQTFRVYIYQESVLAEAGKNYTTAEQIADVFADPPVPGNT